MGNKTSSTEGGGPGNAYSQPQKADIIQAMLKFGFDESLSALISDFLPYTINVGCMVNNGEKSWRSWKLDENASFVIAETKKRARDDHFAPRSRQIAIFTEIHIDERTLVECDIDPLIQLGELVPTDAKECVIWIRILDR